VTLPRASGAVNEARPDVAVSELPGSEVPRFREFRFVITRLWFDGRSMTSSSKTTAWLLAAAFPALAAAACTRDLHAGPAPAFAMNGWQFHELDLPKLEQAIGQAPRYGVDFFIFSHELFRSVEGFLASDDDARPDHPPPSVLQLRRGENFRIVPGWKSNLRRLGDLATKQGIPYYLWVHEFDDVPTRFLVRGRVNMDDPALWDYLRDRYQRLLAAMPGAAGFVLTLHESDLKVFRHGDVATTADVSERIYRVSKLLYDLLKKEGKQLIVRNFFYEPLEMEYFRRGVERLPDDVMVMSKDTTHEFHPFYPWDPLHGQMGRKRQIIEVDLGVEKAWSPNGAYAQTDFIRRAVLRGRDTHATGMVGRARLHAADPFADSHEVNLYAFSRFMADPALGVDRVLADWAGRRYPAAAVPAIVSAYRRSEAINHHGRWHLEYWFTKGIGGEWGDYAYVYSRVLQRSRYKWTGAAADRDREQKLYHPDAETFSRAVKEKDEVIAQVRASQADLREAARHLTPAQLAPLEEDFRFLLDAALLQREWVRAYFAQRMYVDQPLPAHRRTMEEALAALEERERAPGVTYGRDPGSGRRYHIDEFAREMRRRVSDRRAAMAEDARILELTRLAADVANR
jgi:hypothetical protein